MPVAPPSGHPLNRVGDRLVFSLKRKELQSVIPELPQTVEIGVASFGGILPQLTGGKGQRTTRQSYRLCPLKNRVCQGECWEVVRLHGACRQPGSAS